MKRRFNFQKNVQLKLILYDIRKAVPKVIETLKYKKFLRSKNSIFDPEGQG